MSCEQFKPLFLDYWTGALSVTDETALAHHLAQCESCRREADHLGQLWQDLALIPAEEPSSQIRTRFYEALFHEALFHEALRTRRSGTESAVASDDRGTRSRWLPSQPVWQFALSLGCLIVGLGLGAEWSKNRDNGEVAHLKAEVDSTRELVVLSLLRQESASDRLRGVSWANQVASADTDVVAALVESVNHDPSVNVRLAAVEALRSFSGNPLVRQAISPGITGQSAPLMQVALIELAVDLKQHQAAGVLRQMANSSAVDPGVQERARWALQRLE